MKAKITILFLLISMVIFSGCLENTEEAPEYNYSNGRILPENTTENETHEIPVYVRTFLGSEQVSRICILYKQEGEVLDYISDARTGMEEDVFVGMAECNSTIQIICGSIEHTTEVNCLALDKLRVDITKVSE